MAAREIIQKGRVEERSRVDLLSRDRAFRFGKYSRSHEPMPNAVKDHGPRVFCRPPLCCLRIPEKLSLGFLGEELAYTSGLHRGFSVLKTGSFRRSFLHQAVAASITEINAEAGQ